MEINNKSRKVFSSLFTVEDIVIIILFVYMKISNRNYGDDISVLLFSYVDLMFVGYFLLRLLFQFGKRNALDFVILVIEIAGCYESVLGILQIIGVAESNNTIFLCTGTFDNPGPLGGFLAINLCISMAVVLDKKELIGNKTTSTIDKLLQLMSYISIVLCTILFPSTQSRAALLSIIAASFIYLVKESKIRSWIFYHWFSLVIIVVILFSFVFIFKRPSMNGRFIAYKIELMAIKKNGYRGVGLGHFSNSYGKTQRDYFSKVISLQDGELKYCENDKERLFADNPKVGFNDYFQFVIEFGMGPMLIFLLLVLLIGHRLYKVYSPFCHGLISLLVFALFSYPFSLWEFCLLFLVFAAYAGSRVDKTFYSRGCSFFIVLIYLVPSAILIKSFNVIRTKHQAETKWENQRFIFGNGDYQSYEYCCSQLYPNMKSNCAFLYEYAYSLFMNGDLVESEIQANKSLALSGNALTYILLGDIHKELGLIKEAETDYFDSFLVLPDRLYPLYKLAALYYGSNQMINYRNMVRSIENFHPRIESQSTKDIRDMTKDILDKYDESM